MLDNALVNTTSTQGHLLTSTDTSNRARAARALDNMNVVTLAGSWHKPESSRGECEIHQICK